MSGVSFSISRVTSQMQNSLLIRQLTSSQIDMMKTYNQMSTNDALSVASDDPAAAVAIERLDRELSVNTQYKKNLNYATGFLAVTDSTIGQVTTLANQAKSVASSMAGSTTSAEERSNQAAVIDSLLSQLMTLANKQYQGTAIFGGVNGAKDPYIAAGSGYKFQGSDTEQSVLTASGEQLAITTAASKVFGGLSAQVTGYKNLAAGLSGDVAVSSLKGASGTGINLGTFDITGGSLTSPVTVDLSGSKTAQDIVNKINTGLAAASTGATASINATTGAIQISTGTDALTFSDVSGTGAADLGFNGVTAGASSTTSGANLGASSKITLTTPLSALNNGAGITGPGFTITNGTSAATITLAGVNTVQDLLNKINYSGTNVRAEINSDGIGINILNTVSGTQMRISENGGTTADQLGVRSLNAQTLVADLNNGTGISPIANTTSGPAGSIVINRVDGTQLTVNVNGVTTQAGMISAINTAAGYAMASANATGNGISINDTAVGAGNVSIVAGSNYVSNGTDLGIFKTGTAGSLTGSDMTFSTDDVRITKKDGTSFTVSFAGCVDMQDVLDRINNAGGNAGSVVADLNPNGNGIRLTDSTTGATTFSVNGVNASSAGANLGIVGSASASTPGEILGTDQNGIMPESIFSTLVLLRNALRANDTQGITRAGTMIENDVQRSIEAQGAVGTREQDVSSRLTQLDVDNTQLKSARSLLADTDMTEAATKYSSMSTAYEAALKAANMSQNLNLIDFLS